MVVSPGLEGVATGVVVPFIPSRKALALSMYCPMRSAIDLSIVELSSANRTTWWPWFMNFSSSWGRAPLFPLIAAYKKTKGRRTDENHPS